MKVVRCQGCKEKMDDPNADGLDCPYAGLHACYECELYTDGEKRWISFADADDLAAANAADIEFKLVQVLKR